MNIHNSKNNIFMSRDVFYMLPFMAIIALVLGYQINSLYGISIVGDEFGYWTNAAYLYGIEWTDITKFANDYYSYGYSLFLIPFFFLKNSRAMYCCAVVLNIIFIEAVYVMIFRISKKMYAGNSIILRALISFTISLYSYNIFSSITTQAETCLTFVFWLLISFFYEIIYSGASTTKIIACGCLTSYIYMVHMRSIGIVVAACMIIILFGLDKKITISEIIIFFCCICVGFLFAQNIKNNIMLNVYSNDTGLMANDIISQSRKLDAFLSFKGLKELFYSTIGKLWYIGCATFLLAWIGIVACFREIYMKIKIRDIYFWEAVLCLLMFIMSFGLDVVAMRTSNGRLDLLIYGRYFEYTVGPLLLIGYREVVNSKISIKSMTVYICILIVLTKIIDRIYTYYGNPSEGYFNHCVGIAGFALQNGSINSNVFEYVVLIRVLIIIILVYAGFIWNKKAKNIGIWLGVLVVGGCWIYTADTWINHEIIPHQMEEIQDDYNMMQIIKNDKDRGQVFYFVGQNDLQVNKWVGLQADYLQYSLVDIPISLIQFDENESVEHLISDLKSDDYVILHRYSKGINIIEPYIDEIYTNKYFVIGKRKN